jgi:hypothetical protein
MTQKWDTTGDPKPVSGVGGDNADVWMTKVMNGVDTAITRYSGTGDPSSGAGWGSAQIGATWLDTSGTTGGHSPVEKEWAPRSTGGHGWRVFNGRREVWVDDAPDIGLAGSPAGADLAFANHTLTSTLNTYQDANFQTAQVREVLLACKVTAGASETYAAGEDKGYLQLRKDGTATNIDLRVYAVGSGLPGFGQLWVPVAYDGTDEKIQRGVKVGNGTPSFAFVARLLAFREAR